jgi:CheY-like chemotaxis protein
VTRAVAPSLAEPPREPVGGPQPAGVSLRVLVAEDNSINQLVLKALLGGVGIEPVLVSNGQEALDAWRAELWDIVLMDIQMPVMDGLTAVNRMRAAERREGRPRTPVIAVTANAMTHQKAEYLAADMDAVVTKPIDLACLLQAMDAALEPDEGVCDASHRWRRRIRDWTIRTAPLKTVRPHNETGWPPRALGAKSRRL